MSRLAKIPGPSGGRDDLDGSADALMPVDATIGGMWPELTVRGWRGVLARRQPDWGSWDDDDDLVGEAREAIRLHELRGLVMAQVAEIEDLLRFIVVEAGTRVDDDSRSLPLGRITAGGVLRRVEQLLDKLGLTEQYRPQIALVQSTIHRRNQLVHATVQVGFSKMGEYGPRVPVIVLLMEQHDRPPDHPQSPPLGPGVEQTDGDDFGEISEFDLERDLEKAYEALEAAVNIWEAIDQELPSDTTR